MKLSTKSIERLLAYAESGASLLYQPAGAEARLFLKRARAALLPPASKITNGRARRRKGQSGERDAILYLQDQGFGTTRKCTTCNESGVVTEDVAQAGDQVLQETISCPDCGGYGYFKDRGELKRGFQTRGGGKEQADVLGTGVLHVEVKRQQTINIHAALQQACDDAPEGKIPIVLHRRNHDTWKVTLKADDFFKIFRESEFMDGEGLTPAAESSECPHGTPHRYPCDECYLAYHEEQKLLGNPSMGLTVKVADHYGNEAPLFESFGEDQND